MIRTATRGITTPHTIRWTNFADATETVAKEYKTPVLNNYSELGINRYNRLTYIATDDGVHHNAMGKVKLASKVVSELSGEF